MSAKPKKITTVQVFESDQNYIRALSKEHGLRRPAVLAAIIRGFRNASPTVQAQAFDLSKANETPATNEQVAA
jgi:hypothetical protein